MPRPRDLTLIRHPSGASAEHRKREREDHAQAIARRAARLRIENFISPDTAGDGLSGYTLGKLFLRYRADRMDPCGISSEQLGIGRRWGDLCRQHAVIMGYKLNIRTPTMDLIGGGISCSPEPTPERINEIRGKWRDSYNALMFVCKDHGLRVRDVTYGVCVEDWPIGMMGAADFGRLRIGLNAVGKAME